MAAFNEIGLDHECPECHRFARIVAQLHLAASWGGSSAVGFHLRKYGIGDRLPWFDRSDEQFAREWRESAEGAQDADNPGTGREACYAECSQCGKELCVVLAVVDFVVQPPALVTRIEDWPSGYWK